LATTTVKNSQITSVLQLSPSSDTNLGLSNTYYDNRWTVRSIMGEGTLM
jgi:hypothetical protein